MPTKRLQLVRVIEGPVGPQGKSAYQTAVQNGFEGTEQEWVASLKGERGEPGETPHIGENGNWFIGETDTGKPSRGEKGEIGSQGINLVLNSDDKLSNKSQAASSLSKMFDSELSSILTYNAEKTITLSADIDLKDVVANMTDTYQRVVFQIDFLDANNKIYHAQLSKSLIADEPITMRARLSTRYVISDKIVTVANIGIYIQGVASGTAIIRRPKIEIGAVENPVWTPAPQDLVGPPGESAEVDPTLTKPDQAAEAKATGDKIAQLEKSINKILEDSYPYTYGFVEHMDILSPSNRIEYVGINQNFTAMSMNLTDHTTNYGSWSEFPSLVENKPYMVRPTGEADYELDPNDYTKKLDGSESDVANTAYEGGAFAKFPKVYVKRWVNGNDRHVRFSFIPLAGYHPCGFVDTNGKEMDYLWIPMFYGSTINGKMRSLSGLQPDISQNTDTQNKNITAFSDRAAFFAGPIIETIRDMLYMLFKTTDIQTACGKGNSYGFVDAAPYHGVLPNAVVAGRQFYGSNTGKELNKIFHSIVLGSHQQWQRDPYYIVVNGRYKVSTDYTYDLTGEKYIDTKIDSETVDTSKWLYPSVCKPVNEFGSIPVAPFSGSTSIGYCDGVHYPQNKNFTAVVLRFGNCEFGSIDGPGCLNLYCSAGLANWHLSASVLLRPPAAA